MQMCREIKFLILNIFKAGWLFNHNCWNLIACKFNAYSSTTLVRCGETLLPTVLGLENCFPLGLLPKMIDWCKFKCDKNYLNE